MSISVNDPIFRLPEEMKRLKQWCIAGPDKAPYVMTSKGLVNVSVHDNNKWHDFNTAVEIARGNSVDIGFMITKEDSFTCIDLDIKDINSRDKKGLPIPPHLWTTQEQLGRYCKMVSAFDSYTELSQSRKGVHIWVNGAIGDGGRRDGVEVYSQLRFIICTGYSFDNTIQFRNDAGVVSPVVTNWTGKPVKECQPLLNMLIGEIRKFQNTQIELEEIEQEMEDWEIVETARHASNGAKFDNLCNGHWDSYGYPSQSEADLSLMSMFTFYSKSNAQCKRIFRMTALGKRDKAVNNDVYLNRTLRIIRSREQREINTDINIEEISKKLLSTMKEGVTQPLQGAEVKKDLPVPDKGGLQWPPGVVGELAKFIYYSAPRPVKEVGIVAALGFVAGIVGKSFILSQSGLNIYLILIARSAVGKEAMHSGISLVLEKLRNSIPMVQDFVNFNDFASGPALIKACAANPSFVNVSGEWGKKLKRLSHESGNDSGMQTLRTAMTNLYQKSGPTSIVGGLSYSNKEQNVSSLSGVAYSMIGETTPGTFYDSLTDSMMEDGFLSRFTIIEYSGDRPASNKNQILTPNPQLTENLCRMITQSLTLLSRFQSCPVQFDPISKDILDNFDKECDDQINSTTDESWRQMWNRAHLKSIRISALLAVADNPITPIVGSQHIEWALSLIRNDIKIMSRRIESGDVGIGDASRERKLISIMHDFCIKPIAKSYKVPDELVRDGIIPRKFMQTRTARASSFVNHRLGSTTALDMSLRSLVDSGYIYEMSKDKMLEKYTFHGRCFRIVDLPALHEVKT